MDENGSQLGFLLRKGLHGDGPLYRQLAETLKGAIDRGELALGTTLPPERTLARSLAVSRSTVVAAYDRLKTEGWLESRQGSGTWVRRPDEKDRGGVDAVSTARLIQSAERSVPSADSDRLTGTSTEAETIDLSVAALAGSPTVSRVLASLTAADLDPLLSHHGYLPHGLPELRGRIAAVFTEAGLGSTDEQVVVTTGAHQAISLVARQTLQAGDTVVVESPTFPGALDVFRRFGARAVPLPVDEHGARTDVLEELLLRNRPKLLYVSPHFHNPTGAVMPESRRRQLAELADRTETTVVEDLAMGEIAIDDGVAVPPPIAAFSQGQTVHTIGSASKLFWAGLRIGWVRSPRSWSTRMLSTKTVADLGSSVVSQLLTARLLDHTDAVRAERRAQLRARRDLMDALLAEHLPDWSWNRPAGGLSFWVHLPSGNAEEFTDTAARHGVAIISGPSLSADDGNRRAIRLVFSAPEAMIERGIERLRDAWADYVPSSTRTPTRLLV